MTLKQYHELVLRMLKATADAHGVLYDQLIELGEFTKAELEHLKALGAEGVMVTPEYKVGLECGLFEGLNSLVELMKKYNTELDTVRTPEAVSREELFSTKVMEAAEDE
jgi:hypothetical protein